MRFWKSILTLLLMAAWLPSTAHCGLEVFEVLPMDECCEQEHSGSHRCDGGCTVVEDGGLKTECVKVLPVPPSTFLRVADLAETAITRTYRTRDSFRTFESTSLPRLVVRTALPIRGPSAAS